MERKASEISNVEIEKQREYSFRIRDLNIESQKKYLIYTYGCQMNEHDSEKLAGMLLEMGYTETDNQDDADLILFNTCCVRESAEFKVLGNVGALKALKKEKPGLVIAVGGCMMQQDEVVQYIKQKYKHVSIVFGTHNIHRLPSMIYKVLVNNKKLRIYDVWENEVGIVEDIPIHRKESIKAYVTVMYGCNNFCTYCIVPYVRGRERSRALSEIVNEVEELVKSGVREVMLLGQNVNSYGKDLQDGKSFANLLVELNKIKDLYRIRFTTSHPKDISDELIFAIRDLKKVCESVHLPYQAGSTKVLREMNRHYTKENYIELINKIRYHIPDVAVSTDIIVGFPGETEEDFLDTLDVTETVRFDMSYTFNFSKRLGTIASKREDQVDEATKKERFDRLLALQTKICREKNLIYKDNIYEILVEGESRNNKEKLSGRTRTNKVVNFEGNKDLIGKLVLVRIDEVKTWSLDGSYISSIDG